MSYMRDSTGKRLDAIEVTAATPLAFDALAAKRARLLAPFYAKLARRGTERARLLFMCDSRHEGARVSNIDKRAMTIVQNGLRSYYGVTGGAGYIPAAYGTTDMQNTSPWTAYSTAAPGHTIASQARGFFGLGRRCQALTFGDEFTLTLNPGTRYASTHVDICFARPGAISKATISLNGNVLTTVNASGDAVTQRDGLTYRVTLPNKTAQHVIKVAPTSDAQVFYLEGAMLFDGDTTNGIVVLDGTSSGTPATAHAVIGENGKAAPNNVYASDLHTGGIGGTAAAPFPVDLVLVALLTNDYLNGSSVQATTPAAYKAALQQIVTNARGFNPGGAPPPIIFHRQAQRSLVGNPAAPWSAYDAAMLEVVAEDGGILLFDTNTRMPYIGPVTNTPNTLHKLFFGDLIHEVDAGHDLVGNALLRFLLP